MTTAFNKGNPPEPGLYHVFYAGYGNNAIYAHWSGRKWFSPAFNPYEAERYALVRELNISQSLEWKELHNG
ncbi:hypothetical protein ACO0LG_08600 [Undibacterium sp. Ji42W]|uniref:hypothetical protein n=1 Tax=Undibacterium sp. Ji42W TaxID=3413039 RepID=UPI003BF356DF